MTPFLLAIELSDWPDDAASALRAAINARWWRPCIIGDDDGVFPLPEHCHVGTFPSLASAGDALSRVIREFGSLPSIPWWIITAFDGARFRSTRNGAFRSVGFGSASAETPLGTGGPFLAVHDGPEDHVVGCTYAVGWRTTRDGGPPPDRRLPARSLIGWFQDLDEAEIAFRNALEAADLAADVLRWIIVRTSDAPLMGRSA